MFSFNRIIQSVFAAPYVKLLEVFKRWYELLLPILGKPPRLLYIVFRKKHVVFRVNLRLEDLHYHLAEIKGRLICLLVEMVVCMIIFCVSTNTLLT